MINKKILNYVIIEEIGSGGMATVYKAQHETLKKRQVAIKILDPLLARRGNISQRFINEAQIMAELEHQNIVQVIDFEQRPDTLAIVMELLTGQELTDFIHQNGALSQAQAAGIMLPVLDAFAFAHSKNVVHRDVKPANIFITADGTPKILDFGIAKLVSDIGDITTTGVKWVR